MKCFVVQETTVAAARETNSASSDHIVSIRELNELIFLKGIGNVYEYFRFDVMSKYVGKFVLLVTFQGLLT